MTFQDVVKRLRESAAPLPPDGLYHVPPEVARLFERIERGESIGKVLPGIRGADREEIRMVSDCVQKRMLRKLQRQMAAAFTGKATS